MRIAGKFIGVSAALVAGAMMFLAPEIVTGGANGVKGLPVDAAHAEPGEVAVTGIKSLDDADDAWFEAAREIERSGPTPDNLARLDAADDAWFETAMTMEAEHEEARQIARIEAADDAWFEAAILIEITGGTPEHFKQLEEADDAYDSAVAAMDANVEIVTRLARMKARDKLDAAMRLAFSSFDDVVTGSLPSDAAAALAADPMTTRLRRPDPSGNGYFDVMISAGAQTEDPAPMLRLENTSDSILDAVGAIRPVEVDPDTQAPEANQAAAIVETKGEARDPVNASAPAPSASARKAAPRRAHTHDRRAMQAEAAPRFQDRGPVAKLFRLFVKGVGFLPSQL